MSGMQWSTFNWVDLLIVVVIALSMLISFMRGFVKEIVSITMWLAALILALIYANPLAQHFGAIASHQGRYALAFIAIMLSVLIAGVVINAILAMLVDKSGISVVDRSLGLFFGAGRGVLLVAVSLMLVQFMGLTVSAVQSSRLVVQFSPLVGWLDNYVPARLDTLTSSQQFQTMEARVNPNAGVREA